MPVSDARHGGVGSAGDWIFLDRASSALFRREVFLSSHFSDLFNSFVMTSTTNTITNPVYGHCPTVGGAPVFRNVDHGEICPVCRETVFDGKTIMRMGCGHFVCRPCMRKAARLSDDGAVYRCPLCRDVAGVEPVAVRALVRGVVIKLDDVVVKEEPVEEEPVPMDTSGDEEMARRLQAELDPLGLIGLDYEEVRARHVGSYTGRYVSADGVEEEPVDDDPLDPEWYPEWVVSHN